VVSGVEGGDGVDYGLLLVFAEFGVHREREDFVGGGFADGEVALLVPEAGEAGLEMEWEGVVDLAADFLVGEVLAECVAAWSADDVLVEDVAGARVGDG